MASSGARAHRLAPYNEVFHILTMPVEHRKRPRLFPGRGVQHRNTFYWHPIFAEPTIVPGTFVHFRPDIDDLGSLYVYVTQAECTVLRIIELDEAIGNCGSLRRKKGATAGVCK